MSIFSSLFSSKNQKLVKEWIKEHEEIVKLAGKVIENHAKGDLKATKKELKKLKTLAVNHIMTEDIELSELLKEEKRFDETTKKLVYDFNHTFSETKSALISFLNKYTKDDAQLDTNFINTFNKLVSVLAKRIEFEEKNLYAKLESA